jgi:hypothetical protein
MIMEKIVMPVDPSRGADPHDDEKPVEKDEREKSDPFETSDEEGATASSVPEESDAFEEEPVQEYVDPDVQSRLWLKAVVPLLQLRTHETDPSGRVQFAFDLMYIAACERIARILRSDITSNCK